MDAPTLISEEFSPEGRAEWRLRAPYHAQLQLSQTVAALKVLSITVVQGEVVRSLGGDRRLKCGDRVDFKRAVHAGDLRRSVSAWKPAEL